MASPTPPQSDLDPATDHSLDGAGDQVTAPVPDPDAGEPARAAEVTPAEDSAEGSDEDSAEDTDEFDDEFEDDEPALAADAEPVPERSERPTIVRRVVSALIATVVFEALYAISIGLVAFFSAGFAAVGPTLGSAIGTPFAWVPAVVFLVVFAVLATVRLGGRRALAVGTLIAAVVVYLGSTLVVLLVAGGWTAVGVFTQELGVYPFFLTGIIAREILFWGHARTGPARAAVAPSGAS
jgi:hypothetical protein